MLMTATIMMRLVSDEFMVNEPRVQSAERSVRAFARVALCIHRLDVSDAVALELGPMRIAIHVETRPRLRNAAIYPIEASLAFECVV